MISFIVIGENEGWRLEKCFTSIFNVVKKDNIKDYEVIYVDSKSTDDSIKLARRSYESIKIFQITGECNAAIARNIGAKEARGDIFFFIDGDMEIQPDFLPGVLDDKGDLTYPFVSGYLVDVIYNNNWEQISKRERSKPKSGGSYETIVGGLFLISKGLWMKLGGMDTKQTRSQDYDLGLRASKVGYRLYRKDILLAYHHMVSYLIRSNYVNIVKYSALLFRKHWNNIFYIKTFISQRYTTLALLISIVGMFFTWWSALIYPLVVLYKTIKQLKKNTIGLIPQLRLIVSRDIVFSYSILFFHPKSKLEEWIQIK